MLPVPVFSTIVLILFSLSIITLELNQLSYKNKKQKTGTVCKENTAMSYQKCLGKQGARIHVSESSRYCMRNGTSCHLYERPLVIQQQTPTPAGIPCELTCYSPGEADRLSEDLHISLFFYKFNSQVWLTSL